MFVVLFLTCPSFLFACGSSQLATVANNDELQLVAFTVYSIAPCHRSRLEPIKVHVLCVKVCVCVCMCVIRHLHHFAPQEACRHLYQSLGDFPSTPMDINLCHRGFLIGVFWHM